MDEIRVSVALLKKGSSSNANMAALCTVLKILIFSSCLLNVIYFSESDLL